MVNTDTMKLEIGLLEPELNIYKLPALDLRTQQSVEDAGRCVFRECSQHLQINYKRFSEDQNEKSLMQIRVGMRRTRVALRIFRDIIPVETRKKFNREFKYFGQCFGSARDLDELLFRTFREDAIPTDLNGAYEALKSLVLQERALEYSKLRTELAQGQLASLLESFEEWVAADWSEHTDLRADKLMKTDIGSFAVDIVATGQKKLLKSAASLETKSLSELHTIRKYVKRCRYQLRFFSSLFEGEKIEEGFSVLVSLQNSLGALNDVSIGLAIMTKSCRGVQAVHLPNCLSFIAQQSIRASVETKAHLGDVQTLLDRYKKFSLTDANLKR